jgi:two-component system nitrate/nitrite response regulator NarL
VNEKRIRVVIADDHAPTREDVRMALEEDPRFEVVAEAPDAFGAIEAAVRERPDVCLLDVNMPGGGVAATWEISARLPETRIVMLTISRDDRNLFGALQAGAAGYLLKDTDHDRLPQALLDALEGGAALSRPLLGKLVERFRDRGARRRAVVAQDEEGRLTSREWQVVDLLRQGLTNSQIARRLVLSPVTVRTHVNSIMRKLGTQDRESLIRKTDER